MRPLTGPRIVTRLAVGSTLWRWYLTTKKSKVSVTVKNRVGNASSRPGIFLPEALLLWASLRNPCHRWLAAVCIEDRERRDIYRRQRSWVLRLQRCDRQDCRHPRVYRLPLEEEQTYRVATWYTMGLESATGARTCCKVDNMYVVIWLYNLCSSWRQENNLDKKNRS